MRRFAALLLAVGVARAQEELPAPRLIHAGFLEARGLDEVSGLAASRLRPDLLWALADSGNPPDLYAVGLDGSHRGVFTVVGVTNRDWEDMDSFLWEGRPCLLIADTGDNEARYPHGQLHIVPEPALPPTQTPLLGAVPVLRTLTFVYEDGPRDGEAMAVDAEGRNVLLLSKREVPVALYSLALDPASNGVIPTARKITEVPHIPQPTPQDMDEDRELGRYRSQVTAMDIAPDGSAAVILTYKNAYRFPRSEGESWADVFQKVPETLPLPRFRQAEALCFAPDGSALYITGEQRPNPLLRVESSKP